MNPRTAGLLLSCALAAAGFAWWSWPLAGHLATHTLILADGPPLLREQGKSEADWGLILANDQNLSLWGAVDNARALLRGDMGGLMTQGQCFPMPQSTALGEHMFEVGVLAAPWWLASGEPVAAYNLSFLSALVVAAAGMFLFLHRHTSSVAASVAGAAAFAFAVPRLVDLPYHPAVIGTHWLPWVLWSFDRVLAREGRGAVAMFAGTLLLASVTGSYPLIAVGIVGGVYGLATFVARARSGAFDTGALGWSVAGVLPAAVVVGAVLAAYSGLQREWTLVSNPDAKFLVSARDYLPGGVLPAGMVALAGLVPLLLLRGAAGRAVAALAAATLAAFLLTTRLPLPGGAWSVYEALARQLPLLDAVRAPGKAGLAVVFGLQALGAIGWSRAMQRLSPPVSAALAVLLVAVVFVEALPPTWARPLLGDGAAMQLREVAPPRERLDVLKDALAADGDRRAVLDLPTGRMVKAPAALLDAAWHGHPTSACYNSLIPPTMREVYAMAARSHSRRGVEELAAAGFGYVIERPGSPAQALSPTSLPEPARLLAFDAGLGVSGLGVSGMAGSELANSGMANPGMANSELAIGGLGNAGLAIGGLGNAGLAIWALPLPGPVHHDPSQLALAVKGGATRAATFAPDSPHELDVEVTNRGTEMWAAPQPLGPLVAEVELRSDDGAVVVKARARGVLPLALAPGATTTVQLVMPQAPPPGSYAATVRIDGFAGALVPSRLGWAAAAR